MNCDLTVQTYICCVPNLKTCLGEWQGGTNVGESLTAEYCNLNPRRLGQNQLQVRSGCDAGIETMCNAPHWE